MNMLDFWKKEEPKQVEDDDPVTKLMKQTGCLELHHNVQYCIAERKDWRLCQEEVKKFRTCMDEYNTRRKESLK